MAVKKEKTEVSKSELKLTDVINREQIDVLVKDHGEEFWSKTILPILKSGLEEAKDIVRSGVPYNKGIYNKMKYVAMENILYGIEKYGNEQQMVEHEGKCNFTYQTNHKKIFNCINDAILKYRDMPTVTYVARETGLSRTTVHKHLNDEKEKGAGGDDMQQLRMLKSNAIKNLYKFGVEDRNPVALRSFVHLIDPKTKGMVTNNYVQVNNLKISQEDILTLPQGLLKEIEEHLNPSLIVVS